MDVFFWLEVGTPPSLLEECNIDQDEKKYIELFLDGYTTGPKQKANT